MIYRKLRIHYLFIKLLFLLLATSIINSASSQTYTNDLEASTYSKIWIGTATIDSGLSYSGSHFSITDSLQPYGLGIEMHFPEERRGQNTIIEIEGWVKSDEKNAYALFVITIENDGKSTFWMGIPLSPVLKEKDQWFRFNDSISVPADITSTAIIKAYLWNTGKMHKVGIDDLKFTFREKANTSYLPKIKPANYLPNSAEEVLLFNSGFYAIYYNTATKNIMISDHNKKYLTNTIFYYAEAFVTEKINVVANNFDIKSVRTKNSLTILRFSLRTGFNKIVLEMHCKRNSPQIDFYVVEKFTKNIDVDRSAIVINVTQKPDKIYRFNRQLHSNSFQKEYWLDKQGIKLGKGDTSFIVYHTPNVSSLQFDTENSRLYVNLDWKHDHPFFRFPLAPDSTDWKLEQSHSRYKKGDKRDYFFSAYAGSNTKNIPRFMKNPSGFEATYIWTEHADYSDIRTNRATYFGSENISHPDSATGGFVKFNIPVTKSVFYDNPDSITNFDASGGVFTTLESTILTDSLFAEFLFQIDSKGSEICLHTPEQYTTTHRRLDEALWYMEKNFGSPSWIDHGNNNGPQNNREDLICDGTLKDSPYYAIDLWNKYGVNYLHNAYYEELNTYNDWQFNRSLEKPYSGYGDFFPKPDYYQHPTRSGNLFHWPTTSALFVKEHYLWDYFFNSKNLQNFVDNRAVEINHTYPAWVDPQKGMWTYDADSTIVAQPGFNRALANMAQLRDEGKLNVCTIEDFLNYRISVDEIDYRLLPDGRIRLTNNSNTDINDLAMVAKAKAVTVNGLIPNQKNVDDEIIFWFDLKAGKCIVIRVVE
ncbi:MAG: hypothetical protein H8E34_06925 [Bacteroidetes bacterium]|nr:hypothetical protein [Bacteroidota bacterium]MBL6943412.1 hypothetical protein [Bacteroidales bacterium]